MEPPDLIKAAQDLVTSSNGRPRQANLLRATSTVYYALFHTLARSCADLLIGGSGALRSQLAWQQTYRALEHGSCKKACRENRLLILFPQEIQDFANLFITMQEKRHNSDYDPLVKAYKSEVLLDIRQAEAVIIGFNSVPIKHRRAFAAFVLFKRR